MKQDDIIRLATEAGWTGVFLQWHQAEKDTSDEWPPTKESLAVPITMQQIERFAQLVAAEEREACAKLVAKNAKACAKDSILRSVLQSNATAIRAREKA